MGRIRTTGDMCALYVGKETVYGMADTTPAYMGRINSTFSDKDADETDNLGPDCGSRVSSGTFLVSKATGFSCDLVLPRGNGLLADWVKLAIGGDTVQSDLESFTACVKVGPAEWHIFTGCKIESLSLAASSIGQKLVLTVEATARVHSMTASASAVHDTAVTFADVDGASVTVTIPAALTGAPVCYSAYPTVDSVAVPTSSWEMSVTNSLESSAGPSADGTYGLAAGDGIIPQGLTVKADLTARSRVYSQWDADRLLDAFATHSVAVTADGTAVTATGASLDAAGPDRSPTAPYDEKASFSAESITVS